MSLLSLLDDYTTTSIWKIVFHEVLKELRPVAIGDVGDGHVMSWGDGPLRHEHDLPDQLDHWFWKEEIVLKPHRRCGPAIRAEDRMMWCVNGLLHRERDRPALITQSGDCQWWVNGQCHRGGGLPAIIYQDGSAEWWHQGVLHRAGGLPAVIHTSMEYFGEGVWTDQWNDETWTHGHYLACDLAISAPHYFEWRVHGQLHRDIAEGPAVVEYNDEGQLIREEYWTNGCRVDGMTTGGRHEACRR
jgi:hypothetical protein